MSVIYTNLETLAHVYLEDSYVLEIVEDPGTLAFRIEAVLTPRHPRYRPPSPGEQHCYHDGWLTFSGVTSINWIRRQAIVSVDAAGERDLGNIDYLRGEGGTWCLGGDWGDVEVQSPAPELTLLDG